MAPTARSPIFDYPMSPQTDPTPLEFGLPSVFMSYQRRVLVEAGADLCRGQPAELLHVRIFRIEELLFPMQQGTIRPVTEPLEAAL